MTAISFVAKARPSRSDTTETQYTVFASDYGYSLGYIRHRKIENDWTVYNLSRTDIGFNAGYDLAPFATQAAAFAFIRQQYETALATYHNKAAETFAALNADTGLSDIETAYASDAKVYADTLIIVRVITEAGREPSIEVHMTIQEALTALDHLHNRTGQVATIVGRVTPETAMFPNRHGFAGWTIPAGSRHYHLCGFRSTVAAR